MKVLKRSGAVQDFDAEKIKTSLGRVSDDAGEPMTESDINFVAKEVARVIAQRWPGQVSYADIHNVLLEQLREAGFSDIAAAYDGFESSFVNRRS